MERSAASDRDALPAFELALDEQVCDAVHRESWGRLLLTPSLPLIWDANRVDIEEVGMGLDQVVAIADDALGGEGLGHRTICVPDEADGKRLGADLEAEAARWPRWEVERTRYMLWRGKVDAPAANHADPPPVSSHLSGTIRDNCELTLDRGVREVGLAEIADLRRALIAESTPRGVDDFEATVEQLLELDRRYGVAAGDRWFVAPAEGEPMSACRLLRGGAIAQVEEVGTLAPARERGYAKATVRAAVSAAQAEGDATIFVTADAADWPQLMYAKLGFEAVGVLTILRRPP
ncbi:MAG TPA: GNAT family N-acetyltransferase [Solirubrobacterales bacterium]|nr:GNAT family N-acetyltransferase [Solirubrobacterales bacterium]